jgi:hypothetical protein
MTIGVEAVSDPPLSLFELPESSAFCAGGQSTPVGGQLSPPPDPDVSPGGGHPDPAPKSPAPEQSACATPACMTPTGPATSDAEHSATAA